MIENREGFHDKFWKPLSIEELMAQQGITGPQTIRPLEGFDDDVDELVATIRAWRDEDVERQRLLNLSYKNELPIECHADSDDLRQINLL